MRWLVSGKAAHRGAASSNQMGRFETQWLTADANLAALGAISGRWINRVHRPKPPEPAKIGAKVARHERYVAFQLAEVLIPPTSLIASTGSDHGQGRHDRARVRTRRRRSQGQCARKPRARRVRLEFGWTHARNPRNRLFSGTVWYRRLCSERTTGIFSAKSGVTWGIPASYSLNNTVIASWSNGKQIEE